MRLPLLPSLFTKKTKIRIIKSFLKTAGNSGNAGNPLHEVTEKCPYPLSPSTARHSAQHKLSLQSTVALTPQPMGVAHAAYTALGSLPQSRQGRTTRTTDTAKRRYQPSTSAV